MALLALVAVVLLSRASPPASAGRYGRPLASSSLGLGSRAAALREGLARARLTEWPSASTSHYFGPARLCLCSFAGDRSNGDGRTRSMVGRLRGREVKG